MSATVTLPMGDSTMVEVAAWRDAEGVLVIQVDTVVNERVRVNLNDGSVFDQHTETGEDFGDEAHPRGLSFTREQAECWTGYALSDEDLESLEESLPNSSLPETVGTVADALGLGTTTTTTTENKEV